MDKYAAQGIDAATPSSVKGRLDEVRDFHFYGWAADTGNINNKLIVEIIDRGDVVASSVASIMRHDLQSAGIGDGTHGFMIPIPEKMFDGKKYNLTARIADMGVDLDNRIEFVYDNTSSGEIFGLEGAGITGLAKDDDGVAAGAIEIIESGMVIATAHTDNQGYFSARLPIKLFDGGEHLFVARTLKRPVEFATRTILLPAISAGEFVLRHWAGSTSAQDLSEDEKDALIIGTVEGGDLDYLAGLILHSNLFDHVFYKQQTGRTMGVVEAVEHFLLEGGAQGLRALPGFIPHDYRLLNPELPELSDTQCFVHYILQGRQEKRYFNLTTLKRHAAELRVNTDFDGDWYTAKAGNALNGMSSSEHYLAIGWRKGIMPNRKVFDSMIASELYLTFAATDRESDAPPYLRMKEKLKIKSADIVSYASPLPGFDSEYYRAQLKKPLPEAMREEIHYICRGIEQKLDPNSEFSTEYYLRKYPDMRNSGWIPYVHYVHHGRREGRVAKFSAENLITPGGMAFDPTKPTVLVVCHEASRTGAPILGLRLLESFSSQANVISWNGKPGPLTDNFAQSSVAVINTFLDPLDTVWLVREVKKRFALDFAVVNSVATVGVAAALFEEKIPTVSLIHEYADYMGAEVVQMLIFANRVVFPSVGVRASAEVVAVKAFANMTTNVTVRHQGRCALPGSENGKIFTQEDILLALGISEDDEMPAIVLGCGWVQMRKGVEYFIEAARQVKKQLNRPVRFIWVGGGYRPDTDIVYSSWLRSQIVNSDLEEEVIFFEETVDLDPFFELADVFFMSSRLDPFPNVAIDSVTACVPIVAFERGTGFAEFIKAHPSVGAAVPFLDTEAASKVMCEYINGERAAPTRSKEILGLFSFPAYADFVWEECMAAAEQQKAIDKESQMIIQSSFMDTDFLRSSGSCGQPYLPIQYQYVALWARGIKTAKSLVGFNDKIAESAYISTREGKAGAITPLANLMTLQTSPTTHDVQFINAEHLSAPWQGKLRVALHIHAHYTDSLPELLRRLGPIGRKISLCITTNTEEKAKAISAMVEANAEVLVIPNRGRDVGPFIMMLQEQLSGFDIVGHFHLKGTKQLDLALVRQWQDFLYDSLLGKNGEVANELLHAFENNPKLGLLFQEDPNLLGWDKNRAFAQTLLDDLGIKCILPGNIEYPTGNMFWARTAAFAPLMKRKWEWRDFPAEPVPYDGSKLHAIERLTPTICEVAGYKWATVFNPVAKRCRPS